jgi:hypothetical protein
LPRFAFAGHGRPGFRTFTFSTSARSMRWSGPARQHITGDEKGHQIFLDRLFRAFGQKGSLDIGGTAEMRIRKASEDGGGTSFADYVWKPVVLIEMKKRGADLSRHYRQAFDYWVRLVPDLIAIARDRVLPDWQENAKDERDATQKERGEHQNRIDAWWALKRPRGDLQKAIARLPRYVACSAVMKRPIFVFLASRFLPTNALKIFAFADDYSFGVLQSNAHWEWFMTKCSKLKLDFRYTPETVFDTFPWPQFPTAKHVETVAAAAVEVRRVRAEALKVTTGGLRAVYRTLELPGKHPLKDAHAALDAAVLAA